MSGFVWTDAAVRTALGLRTDVSEEGVSFAAISTDSRTISDGDLYVALVGERFDGHDFVAEAIARGGRGAVVSRPVAGAHGDARLYAVADTLEALGALAAHRRLALRAPVVGLTGSVGKTTTKDLACAALGELRRVHATRGNLNNRVGMPLTLLAVPDDAEVVVLEMGTNEPGEIGKLAAVARPDLGVVTTVGESHLERLGSLEGVMEEKLDLLRGLADGGRAFVGDEPPALAERARGIRTSVRVAGWSERADDDLRPRDVQVDARGAHSFAWRGERVRLALPGRHVVTDALLALAIADALGVAAHSAARGVSGAESRAMRGELRRVGDLTVVVDCYNANPQSVRAALDLLEAQSEASRRVAVLGTMLELGAASDELHRRVLEDALARDLDLVVATGAFAAAASAAAGAGHDRVVSAAGWREAYPALRQRLRGGEVILLKASRGIAMEGLLALLEADFGEGAAERAGERT